MFSDKLQAEVRRLQADLELRRLQRLESSDSLLQDVRSRLEGLHHTVRVMHKCKEAHHRCPIQHSSFAIPENSEIMEVLESLVSDNEILKADNEELHTLLTESREDFQAIQSQVEEHIVFAPPIRGTRFTIVRFHGSLCLIKQWIRLQGIHEREMDHHRSSEIRYEHKYSRSISYPFTTDTAVELCQTSIEYRTKDSSYICECMSLHKCSSSSYVVYKEPLTPETNQRPLSPAESMVPSETKYTSVSYPQSQYPPSRFSFDVDEHGLDHSGLHPMAHLTPSLNEHASSSSYDGRSDSSSMLDGQPTHLSTLLERMTSLLLRMSQADALTLTNRLKRQHLRSTYVKHLSRTTVSNILSEIAQLRVQYRVLLEDEKVTVLCTRRDLRGLFKFFKDVFEELGQLRITLNDVIVEPSIAQKVSEMALDPAKAEAMERKASEPDSSWMAPFSKLFGSSLTEANTHPSHTEPRSSRGREITRQPRPVPKLAPALAASTTTVNVEFSGAGVGKSVTSTFSAHPTNDLGPASRVNVNTVPRASISAGSNARSVMGIFAGAPHPDNAADQWVVLPRTPRRARSTHFKLVEPPQSSVATTDGGSMRKPGKSQLSREMDVAIDTATNLDHDEAKDTPGPLPGRTLRRRGLSDSSIHSTYMSQAKHSAPAEPSTRGSVLQTLSRTVRNFSIAASQTVSGSLTSPPPISRAPEGTVTAPREGLDVLKPHPRRAASQTLSSLIPNLSLTSWAAAGAALENSRSGSQAMYYGSVRDDSFMSRPWGREDQREI